MADVDSIFKSIYRDYCSSLKNTSYDTEKNEYLCHDESHRYVYDFDKIVKFKYPLKQPSSYDALLFNDNKVYCVEFKNQKYSDIDRSVIAKKLQNGKEILDQIFKENNIPKSEYKFVFCVVYKNSSTRWQRGIAKNEVQFELDAYKGKFFDEIYTNDVLYFTNEYKKKFKKELDC